MDQGYKAYKIRMDELPTRRQPRNDLTIFKLARDFLPDDIYLGFANNGYSVPTAIQQGRAMENYGRIDHFEEPLPLTSQDSRPSRRRPRRRHLHRRTGHDRWRFRDIIQIGNPDILQPDILNVRRPIRGPQDLRPRHQTNP